MSTERDILAASCDNREAYNRIVKYLGTDDLTDTGRMVWNVIEDYYARDHGTMTVELDTLADQVDASVTNPKHKDTLRIVVDGLRNRQVSGLNVVEAMIALKREVVGAKLATAILGGADTNELVEDFQKLDEAMELEDDDDTEEPIFGWNPADESEEEGELIGIAPASLNNRLAGGCMRGHHIIIFARPEMGKTSFLANLTNGFLKQGHKVLYIGNEDPIADVRRRFLGRVIEWPRDRINNDKIGAHEIAEHTTNWANLGTVQLAPGTPREIESLVQRYKPDVLMIDQLRNINVYGNKSDGVVQHLEAAAKAVRQIGIRNQCLVVSVTQAGVSADGKAILDMSDVDSSKTGIPAQADVMIGLGATTDDEAAGRRVLSLPKNKRSGRHDFFPVKVDFVLGKFESIGEA